MRIILMLIVLLNLSFAKKQNNKNIVGWNNKLVKEYKYDFLHYVKPNKERMKYLKFIWKIANKKGLGYTALAIAWEESKYNLWGVNELTADYGLMGINIKWYLNNKKINANYWQKKAIITKLIRDDMMNLKYSLSELSKWRKKIGKNNWIELWARYNGGSTPNYYYANRILNRIIILKRYLNKNDLK